MKNAKRFLLIAILSLLTIGSANAEFRYGVRAGMNINHISLNKSYSQLFEDNNSCGWNIGVMAEYTVPIIGIGVDLSLLYSRMNNGIDDEILTTDNLLQGNTDKEHMLGRNFIEIPLNIKYKVNIPAVNHIVRPYIFTGPSFAFKLDKNTAEYFKSRTCQVAWNVGLGLELIKHLQLSASYGFGINNIASATITNATKLKAKNNYWTISLGYLF